MFLSFKERAAKSFSSVAKELFHLMEEKSLLSVSADLTRADDVLDLANQTGPYISLLKTHVDIIEDFSDSFLKKLKEIAKQHNFLLFEDRKFADIGNTVSLQYAKGVYHIADWAHLVNAHILPGPGIIDGLKKVGLPLKRGLLLLAQMSSEGSLFTPSYTEAAIQMAEKHKEFVIGFICLKKIASQPYFLHLTPGVKLEKGKDSLGQNWASVEDVIYHGSSDMIIVGRDIYGVSNPKEQARLYQEQARHFYEKRQSHHHST